MTTKRTFFSTLIHNIKHIEYFTELIILLASGFFSYRLTTYIYSQINQPNIVKVATYGKKMPWDSLLSTKKSPFYDDIANMILKWDGIGKDIPSTLPFDIFSIKSVKYNPGENALQSVEGARLSISPYESLPGRAMLASTGPDVKSPARSNVENPIASGGSSRKQSPNNTTEPKASRPYKYDFFKQETELRNDINNIKSIPNKKSNTGILHIAITPERSMPEVNQRINKLCSVVSSYFKENNKIVKVLPATCVKDDYKYEDVIKGLATGEIDFALCSPYSTYIAKKEIKDLVVLGHTSKEDAGGNAQGYNEGYNVFLIKSADKNIFATDIKKMRLISTSAFSTSGYIVPLCMLKGLGVDLNEIETGNIVFFKDKKHEDIIEYVHNNEGCIAGVPSDKIDSYLSKINSNSWYGAVIGVLTGAFFVFLYITFIKKANY